MFRKVTFQMYTKSCWSITIFPSLPKDKQCRWKGAGNPTLAVPVLSLVDHNPASAWKLHSDASVAPCPLNLAQLVSSVTLTATHRAGGGSQSRGNKQHEYTALCNHPCTHTWSTTPSLGNLAPTVALRDCKERGQEWGKNRITESQNEPGWKRPLQY